MLFNSYEFILLFLPLTMAGFFWVGRYGHEAAIGWLVAASLFFYGWWNPIYVWLILISMLVNYAIGWRLGEDFRTSRRGSARFWLTLGISANLILLGWYKYANFFVDTINQLAGTDVYLHGIVLPLAISFFTFQQIAYLVDAYHGVTREYKFSHYLLFVTFFPQLIAGPIVHHKEMLPQFMEPATLVPRASHIGIGLTIFAIGLFKKAVLADGIAPYATPVFDSVAHGAQPSLLVAWGGALAYTFQLYFDFSGYSDMAIGGARMFGILLPLNFHSPYKATSIVEFWRRWHMTLSHFLRDYLYIPLGGNRNGNIARYRNLMITMLLGGLWHGAGWTFLVWGGLHGLYLTLNHAWHWITRALWPKGLPLPKALGRFLAWAVTFVAVVVGWVVFRAADLDTAIAMLRGMAGLNGIALPNAIAARLGGLWELLQGWGVESFLGGGSDFFKTWLWIGTLLVIALIAPNTQQIMARAEPALVLYSSDARYELRFFQRWVEKIQWSPSRGWALAAGVTAGLAVLALTQISEFLYFQF